MSDGEELQSVEYRWQSSAFSGVRADVLSVRVDEALDAPYGAEVHLRLHDADADVAEMLGKDCVLTIARAPLARRVCGVVRTVGEGDDAFVDEQHARVVVVPAVWMLGLRRDTRMFQQKSVPEILETVLSEGLKPYGRQVALELGATYPTREYCLQYQESDLDFVHRLMEEEGISYAFDHEGEVELMVLRDENRAFAKVTTMPAGGVVELHEHGLYTRTTEPLHTFVRDHRHTTTAVAIRDADWTTQGHVVEAAQDGEDGLGRVRESYEHGEGRTLSISSYDEGARRYQQNDAVRQKAVRHEAHWVGGVVAAGVSRVTGFAPGLTFELRGHPTVGVDGQYLITRVVHVNESLEDGADPYHNRFECIPIGVTHRPTRRTKKPRIASIQTAVVTGPSGEEIHVDAHGRVKVRFHWDRENPADDTSSCWIRCQQAWAGQGWGSWWVPRVGMEVIVQFVDGDPDRPMVTGCVYNGENGTPYSLPDDKTKSTIKSNSSPGGGGFNELRFEDRAGSEQIYAHAQKDYDEEILNDHTTSVGNNQTNTVSVDQTQEIGANQTETVHGNQVMTVDGNRTVHVKSSFDETVDANETRLVNGTVTETIQGSETRTVNGGHTETINAGETRTVNGGQTQTVNGGQTETFNGGHTQTITGGSQVSITGSLLQNVSGGVTINTPGTFVVNADAGYTLKTPAGGKVIADGGWTVVAPGGQTQVDSFWDWTGGTWLASAGIKMGVTSFSSSITNIAISATLVSAGVKGLSLDHTDVSLKIGNVKVTTGTIDLKTRAIGLKTAAVEMIS